MGSWTVRLARAIYRKGSDNVKQLPFHLAALLLAVPLFVAVLMAVFVLPSFTKEFSDFRQGRPAIPFSYHNWNVVYGDRTHAVLAEARCPDDPLCLARPENPILWNSHYRRSERTQHFRRVNALGANGVYWIGTRIKAADLKDAVARGYSRIILGYLSASFEIYLNGHLFRTSHAEPARRALILSQLENFHDVLEARQDLHIAVKIINDRQSIFPDLLAEPLPTGLARPEEITYYMRAQVFEWQSSSFLLVGTFFSLGFFFFLIAAANRRKIEYCAISAYAIMNAFHQALQMSLVFSTLGEVATARLQVLLGGLEVAVVLVLGMSICRAHFQLLYRATWTLLSAACLPLLLWRDPFELLAAGDWLWQGALLPSAYLMSGFLCYAQWKLIREDGLQEKLEEDRLSRLAIFSSVFLVMGLVQTVQHYAFSSGVGLDVSASYRIASLVFVFIMGGLAIRTYNVQLQLLNKGITSRYHRRKDLPEFVEGALLEVDIKGSEAIFRLNHQPGLGAALMQDCLSRLWKVVTRYDGEVIRTEGDAITCIFEGGSAREALLKAVDTTLEMKRELAKIPPTLDELALEALKGGEFQFRGSLIYGRLKPTWQTVDGHSQPGWQEAGETNVMVDSSRLQEIEKEVCGRDSSLVVMESEVADALERELAGRGLILVVNGQVFLGKHGRPYRVSGFSPLGPAVAGKKAA